MGRHAKMVLLVAVVTAASPLLTGCLGDLMQQIGPLLQNLLKQMLGGGTGTGTSSGAGTGTSSGTSIGTGTSAGTG